MLTVGLTADAGRAAYLACFHAAQALIFEQSAKVTKTHNGVQAEFSRLTRVEDGIDPEIRQFLSKSYDYETMADYFAGECAPLSQQQAADVVATATTFVDQVEAMLRLPEADES